MTAARPQDRQVPGGAAGTLPLAECLLAMGPVVHRLDYGGDVAAADCATAQATALLAGAYPLVSIDAVGPRDLARAAYDLVCFLHGLADRDDAVADARAALEAVRPTGALMVVEHRRPDAFGDGPIAIGALLAQAGAAHVRLAAATAHGFVLDARPAH